MLLKTAPVVVERTADGWQSPINPLVWWHAQPVAGNEWDGLTQMALDVLSTPGMFPCSATQRCPKT